MVSTLVARSSAVTSTATLLKSTLNTIDPSDYDAQHDAFYAAGLQVAALLQHEFVHERYQYSRSIDPIVGVSLPVCLISSFMQAVTAGWNG